MTEYPLHSFNGKSLKSLEERRPNDVLVAAQIHLAQQQFQNTLWRRQQWFINQLLFFQLQYQMEMFRCSQEALFENSWSMYEFNTDDLYAIPCNLLTNCVLKITTASLYETIVTIGFVPLTLQSANNNSIPICLQWKINSLPDQPQIKNEVKSADALPEEVALVEEMAPPEKLRFSKPFAPVSPLTSEESVVRYGDSKEDIAKKSKQGINRKGAYLSAAIFKGLTFSNEMKSLVLAEQTLSLANNIWKNGNSIYTMSTVGGAVFSSISIGGAMYQDFKAIKNKKYKKAACRLSGGLCFGSMPWVAMAVGGIHAAAWPVGVAAVASASLYLIGREAGKQIARYSEYRKTGHTNFAKYHLSESRIASIQQATGYTPEDIEKARAEIHAQTKQAKKEHLAVTGKSFKQTVSSVGHVLCSIFALSYKHSKSQNEWLDMLAILQKSDDPKKLKQVISTVLPKKPSVQSVRAGLALGDF